MRADMLIGYLEFPAIAAIGDRNTEAEVVGVQWCAGTIRIQSGKHAPLQSDLPSFRPIGIIVAVSPNASAGTQCHIPHIARGTVLIEIRGESRFFGAGHVRLRNNS